MRHLFLRDGHRRGCSFVLLTKQRLGRGAICTPPSRLVTTDALGNVTTFEVDLLHRITATTDRLGKHVAYTYDSVGNQTSVTYPDGTTATKEYDLVHNLTKVVEEDGRTTTYEYDGMGRVTHMEYPDGWVEDYHYDSIGQLLAIEDTDPSQKDMKQQKNVFEYDVCGNMTREYMRGNGTGEATTDVTYTYDELHRVTSAKELYGNAWRSYQYDSLGNLTYEENSNSVHYDYKLNNLNQLVQKTYSSNDKEGTVYTYDNRGNLVKEEYGKFNGNANGNKRQTVAEYTYDETNKMVKGVNSIGESSSYLFNGKNALVEQTWHIAKNGYGYHDVDAGIEDPADTTNGKGGNGSGGKGHGNGNGQGNGNGAGDKPTGTTVGSFSTVVKQFVIDYTVETKDPLMEHEVNGLDYRYVYGNERLSVNISPIPNGAGHIVESGTVGQQIRLYYHQDLRGTVDYLTSPVSQKVESWTHYNEWGEITHNAVLKTGYRELDLVKNYTGHDFDAILNMYYAKARMYDAENRRFVALDPIMDGSRYDISEQVTDPTMFVQYLYVQNNPLIWVDPLGLFEIKFEGIVSKQANSEKMYQMYMPSQMAHEEAQKIKHSLSGKLAVLQRNLRELGYLTISDDMLGIDYGGSTKAAVQLFQMNYGLPIDGTEVDSDLFLKIANVAINKKYQNLSVANRAASYRMQVSLVGQIDHPDVKRDEIYDYYEEFECEILPVENLDNVLDTMTGNVSASMVDGIWYLDYTSVINNTLSQRKQEFFDHRLQTYEEFVNENKFWIFTPSYDSYLSMPVAHEMMWFSSKVAAGKEWDLKLKENWTNMFGSQITYYHQAFKFLYEGEIITSEDLGNITFGYLGSAVGFSETTLNVGAWIAGDGDENEQDTKMVKRGIEKFFNEYGSKYPSIF